MRPLPTPHYYTNITGSTGTTGSFYVAVLHRHIHLRFQNWRLELLKTALLAVCHMAEKLPVLPALPGHAFAFHPVDPHLSTRVGAAWSIEVS